MSKNQFRSACPLLEESHRLDPAVASKFVLAKCYYRMDRHARAFELLEDIQKTAKDPADVKLARDIAAGITPTIGKLTVSLPPPSMRPEGLELHLDGARLNTSEHGSAPVTKVLDLGEHIVLATAPHKVPWRQSFLVTAYDKPITIQVPPLVDEMPPPAPVPQAKTSPWVLPLATLGVLGLAAGTGVGLVGLENEPQRAGLFVPMGGSLVLGGVAMAGAFALWRATSTPTNASTTAGVPLQFVPVVGPGSTFGALRGSF
ncbi:tetratricopeptide repeat protein [Polyangium mundeleinium]|uniref:Tetratricopeptide repeat protein n=1 Tax=Polyangium mundeleinium TaxID=2995306 RepID=A0ABT5ESG3_9BACT|nr:tetratricopeptide repeat protein [Polyangium mundeleinium]MDC0744758.1 tetratricopeptide repeat protein [Polyangium mundeleinium]